MLLKIRRDLGGYLNSRLKRRPFFAVFRITRRCDLRCRMCGVWKHGDKQEEMPLEKISQVASALKKLRIPYIVLTGGEPFLHPNIYEIIDIFHKQGFAIRLETNASWEVTPQKLDTAVANGAIDISVSLDTTIPEKQDYICNSKGIWQQIVTNFDHAMQTFPGDLPLINTVVSRYNYEDMPQLVEFVNDKKAYIMIVPVVLSPDQQQSKNFRGSCEEFVFQPEDFPKVKKIYQQLIKMRKSGYNILNSTRFLEESLKSILEQKLKWDCDAGEYYIDILPNGQVGACSDVPDQRNILENDFINQFRSRAHRARMKQLRANCPGCTYGIYREVSYHLGDYYVLGERINDLTRELKRRILGRGYRPNKANRRIY